MLVYPRLLTFMPCCLLDLNPRLQPSPSALRIGGEGNGTFDAELRGTLDAIVALDLGTGLTWKDLKLDILWTKS